MNDGREREVAASHLAVMTSPDAQERVREGVAVVPVGSIEQHGPHLPLDTDIYLASAVAEEAVRMAEDAAFLCPPVWCGVSEHHMAFSGTLSVRHTTLDAILQDVVESLVAHGCRRVLLLNGHGGNVDTISRAVQVLGHHTPARIVGATYLDFAKEAVAASRASPLGGMSHGCEFETAVMLHLRPEVVRMKELEALPDTARVPRVPRETVDLFAGGTLVMDWRTEELSPSGVVGSPQLATAENGKAWFDACVSGCVEVIRDLIALPVKSEAR